jgi:nucleoside-diphosphate-sugar epimerase
VLVTGASGFVGRHLVPALARAGADVRALVRDRTRVPGAVERHAEVLTGNLVDADVVARAMEGVDLVVHAAAVTTNNVAWRVHEETNIEGTRVVLEQARRAGVKRVVHLSSVIVYGVGATNGGGPVAESAALPQDVDRWAYYQRSKLAAEELARAAEGVEVVILRPGLLYGPGQESPVKRGLVQLGAARLTIGSGRNALPLTFVDNAVDAILLALTRPEAAGETFNVVDDDQPVAREAYRRAMTAAGDDVRLVPVPASLLSALGGWLESRAERADADTPPRVSRFQIASATRDMRYDTAKARTRLGWEPAVSLDEGLRRTFPAR